MQPAISIERYFTDYGTSSAQQELLKRPDKEIVKAAAAAENNLMMAKFNARNGATLAELIETHGVRLSIFPREVWSQIAKVAREVVTEIAQVDALSGRILQSWIAFRKQVPEWQQISDIRYTAHRSITLRF